MSAHFRFAEHAPDQRLTPWIARYWEFEALAGAPPVHHVPPDGGTSLIVAVTSGPPLLIISGPWLEPLGVPVVPGAMYRGIRLQPGAAREFTGVAPESLCNVSRPLGQLQHVGGATIASALGSGATLARAADAANGVLRPIVDQLSMPDPLAVDVAAFTSVSRGARPVGEIAADLGVSPRTMLRRFRQATGITPKQFARVIRFRFAAFSLVDAHPDARLSRVAMAGGYADQPHLNREWAELLGVSPSRLAEIVRATIHENVVP